MDERPELIDAEQSAGSMALHRRVVVGVDGSPGSRSALAWALIAAARKGAVLEVVSAFPIDFYWLDPYLLERGRIYSLRADTKARVRELVDAVRREPAVAAVPGSSTVAVEVIVVPGAPAEHLVQIAVGATLLVVGSRGRGPVRSTLLGSVALHCSTHAPCPVVVVHPNEPATPSRVVVGLDGSPAARAALRQAVDTAAELGAEVEALVVREAPSYWTDLYGVLTESLDEMRNGARRRAQVLVRDVLGDRPPVPVHVSTAIGTAAEALVRQAVGAALLVVGSESRGELSGMALGSVALHCAVSAPCPVMIVRGQRAADRSPGAVVLATSGS